MSPYLVLVLAVLGISVAAPLTRLSGEHPVTIAVWRLGFTLIVVVVALVVTGSWRQLRSVRARDLLLALGAGTMLALHFWSWNASLGYTTVAASVVLVNLQAVVIALGSAAFLGETPSRRQGAGIAVAMAGGAVVALAGGVAGQGSNPPLGNLLAVVGAATAGAYYLAGRSLRGRLSLWPYVALVYGACFVVLLLIAIPLGVAHRSQPPRELLIFAGLALGPMLLGHTGMNWALRYLPAYVVNLTVLGEPVGATLLAAFIPAIGERPSAGTLAGGGLVLAGAVLASWRMAPREPVRPD